jgi:glycine/D-amino acid oxidase-like deaminating enzyme
MRAWMERRLGQMWPAWAAVETERFWSGLIALSARMTPMAGRLPDDPSVAYGLAYHGNGVAMATWTGRALARLLVGANDPAGTSLPAPLAETPRRFPLAAGRVWGLRAAYLIINNLDT